MRFAIVDNNNILLEMKNQELHDYLVAYLSSRLGWMNRKSRIIDVLEEALVEVETEFKRKTVYL